MLIVDSIPGIPSAVRSAVEDGQTVVRAYDRIRAREPFDATSDKRQIVSVGSA
jgi:hypothetical protein